MTLPTRSSISCQLLGEVEVPDFGEDTGSVGVLHYPEASAVVLINADQTASGADADHPVPRIVDGGEDLRRIGDLRHRRGVAGKVVCGDNPSRAGAFGDARDLVDGVGGPGLIQGRGSGGVRDEAGPIAGGVQRPILFDAGVPVMPVLVPLSTPRCISVRRLMSIVTVEFVQARRHGGGADDVGFPESIGVLVVAVLVAVDVRRRSGDVVLPALVDDSSEEIDASERARSSAPQVEPDARLGIGDPNRRSCAEIQVLARVVVPLVVSLIASTRLR